MKKIIIHAHFYQPPRENPWTGVLEQQKEAAPYADWNRRICRECYEANAYSPLLDGSGRIERFFNNYEHISFNVGPTLLSWLEQEEPHVYAKILEGDRLSQRNRGDGNAIAQVYNHMILPLASERDRKTQIAWSLEDFKRRFGRDSRGLWLSETAICPGTAEEMVRSGIEYTILSPHQAERFLFAPPLNGKTENPEQLWRHPWTLDCPSGGLRVYFYHPGLSSGISFNHLLRDADNLYAVIRSELEESEMLAVATDGEIYGHHEALGNMGLSAVLAKIEADPGLECLNFSQLTDRLPPAGQVVLKRGEDGRGSSWSCSHGVSRWYKDCGCATGSSEGWNQSWRTPLRNAFENLSRQAEEIYNGELNKLMPYEDPDDLRNAYASVLTGRTGAADFLSARGIDSPTTQKKILRLLEGQKYAMYCFTSCGWFFADISGVEPVQNLLYAARLLELYGEMFPPEAIQEFHETLAEAQSNLPDRGNGAEIFKNSLSRKDDGLLNRAAALLLADLYGQAATRRGTLRIRARTSRNGSDREEKGVRTGTAELDDGLGGPDRSLSFVLKEDEISFTDITLTMGGKSRRFSLRDLDDREWKAHLGRLVGELGQPDPTAFPRLLRRFGLSSPSIKAAAHSALKELLILMENKSARAWSGFRALLSTEFLREIPLPEGFMVDLYEALERALSHGTKDSPADLIRQILETLPLLSPPEGQPGMTASLAGRIYDLYTESEEGEEILQGLDQENRRRLKTLLNLSESLF